MKLLCGSERDHNAPGHGHCKLGHDDWQGVLGIALPQLAFLLSVKAQLKPETESCLCLNSPGGKEVWT